MHPLPYWRLSGYYFFYFAFIGAFSPYFGLYLQSLSFSAWDIALLMSQMQLMRLFAPYLWGRSPISSRAADGHRPSGGAAQPARLRELFRCIFGRRGAARHGAGWLFWSAALPLVETTTFDHLRDQPARYSRIRLWGSIGFIIAVMATGAWLDRVPCRSAVGDRRHAARHSGLRAGGSQGRRQRPAGTATIVRQPRAGLFAACFAMSAAHGALYVFYSIYLPIITTASSGRLAVVAGVVAEIVVFFYMGELMRRFGLRRLLLASFSAAVARFLMIGWGVEWP